jgi:hypothetical protein
MQSLEILIISESFSLYGEGKKAIFEKISGEMNFSKPNPTRLARWKLAILMPLRENNCLLGPLKKSHCPSQVRKALLLQAIEIPMKAKTSGEIRTISFFQIPFLPRFPLISSAFWAHKAGSIVSKKTQPPC